MVWVISISMFLEVAYSLISVGASISGLIEAEPMSMPDIILWLLICLAISAATLALFQLRAIAVKLWASAIAVAVVQDAYTFSTDSDSGLPISLTIGVTIFGIVLVVSIYIYSRRLSFRGILK